jgi:hypothetical protein
MHNANAKITTRIMLLQYLGWLGTNELVFGIAKISGKVCAYHVENMNEALKAQ